MRTSALLSAFLSRCSRNLQDFVGHRTCVAGAPGTFLDCAWRPMQPLKKRNGMASFLARTFSRYFFARFRLIFFRAAAVTQVFLKCTRRSEPAALQERVAFSGSREYFFVMVTW